MIHFKNIAASALGLVSVAAMAGPLVLSYDSFGPLPGATFSGSGIPNNPVAITVIDAIAGGPGAVTLGLSATGRSATGATNSPAVLGNDGAGVFYGLNGVSARSNAGLTDNLARWNFDFYIGGDTSAYTYMLLGTNNPGDASPDYMDLSGFLSVADSLTIPGTIQNSENLGFNTDWSQFDPTAPGQYGFVLEAFSGTDLVGSTSMVVSVPEPASLALAGAALLGLAVSRRRKS